MQAENEDYELKQVKDMTAARKRWEALVIFLKSMGNGLSAIDFSF